MGADYIPEKYVKAAVWMKHFAAALVEQSEIYRTSVEIDELVHAFRVANATCGRPVTCSPVARKTREDSRKAAERLVRPAATRINKDPRIAADLKVAIGLKPREKRRQHIDPPQSVPVLKLRADLSGRMHIRVRDSQSSRRARPKSAAGLELYERITPQQIAEGAGATDAGAIANVGADDAPSGWRFVGVFTRTPIVIYPAAKATGEPVWYVARWFSRRGEPGKFGDPRTLNAIVSGGVRPCRLQLDHRRAA